MGRSVVTGANRGIGLELCRKLKARGASVLAVCRKSSPELDALGVQVAAGIDVVSDDAGAQIEKRLDGAPIDLLVHNAGILRIETLERLDVPSIREQFEVNALAPIRLTSALLSSLGQGSRIAVITSLMGSSGDNRSGGAYGYRMSKAALNVAAVSLARDLAPKGIWVAILHPGYVRTEMTRNNGNVDPADAAEGLLARIDALGPETTGRFFHQNGKELPW
jgi:NAD(P)-dependent dehydrogenase (short-subunit alcohol dehydrogenase family)